MNDIYFRIIYYFIYFTFSTLLIFNIVKFLIRMKRPLRAQDSVYILTGKKSSPKFDLIITGFSSIFILILIFYHRVNMDELIREIAFLIIILNWPIAMNRQVVIFENGIGVKSINVIIELYEWNQITDFQISKDQHRDYEYNLLIKYGRPRKRQHKFKLKIEEDERRIIQEFIEKYYKVNK